LSGQRAFFSDDGAPNGGKSEMRWYRGARRPQQDAGVFVFREKRAEIRKQKTVFYSLPSNLYSLVR
jgi:hypothetical protein